MRFKSKRKSGEVVDWVNENKRNLFKKGKFLSAKEVIQGIIDDKTGDNYAALFKDTSMKDRLDCSDESPFSSSNIVAGNNFKEGSVTTVVCKKEGREVIHIIRINGKILLLANIPEDGIKEKNNIKYINFSREGAEKEIDRYLLEISKGDINKLSRTLEAMDYRNEIQWGDEEEWEKEPEKCTPGLLKKLNKEWKSSLSKMSKKELMVREKEMEKRLKLDEKRDKENIISPEEMINFTNKYGFDLDKINEVSSMNKREKKVLKVLKNRKEELTIGDKLKTGKVRVQLPIGILER